MCQTIGSAREKKRDLYRVALPAPNLEFTSFSDTCGNARTALLERVFYHEIGGVFTRPAHTAQAEVVATLKRFRSAFKRFCPTLTPVPLQDYALGAYRGQKLQLYLRATAKVLARGPLRSDAYLSTFLKHEKIPVTKKRAVPRVIQPRAPEYNVCVGRYLRHAEHIVYKTIDKIFGRPTVMKGYNSLQLGTTMAQAWEGYDSPAALGLDASRFDQHISPSLLKWEHSIYSLLYPCARELAVLLSWQVDNRGWLRTMGGDLRYRVQGGRCSGDMNTAMGNCLIMCAAVHSLLAKCKLAGCGRSKITLLNNGDDCVLIGERADIDAVVGQVPDFFTSLGIVMKVEPVVHVLEQVSFCQCQPVYDGRKWRATRDPRVSMAKDLYVLSRDHATSGLSNQLYAIGECGLALTGGLPVLQEYYSALIRNQRKGKRVDHRLSESGFFRLAEGMHESYQPVTDAARVSFCRAFGIVPDVQTSLERLYSKLTVPIAPVGDGYHEQVFLQ